MVLDFAIDLLWLSGLTYVRVVGIVINHLAPWSLKLLGGCNLRRSTSILSICIIVRRLSIFITCLIFLLLTILDVLQVTLPDKELVVTFLNSWVICGCLLVIHSVLRHLVESVDLVVGIEVLMFALRVRALTVSRILVYV
jgi:hypothetical protein